MWIKFAFKILEGISNDFMYCVCDKIVKDTYFCYSNFLYLILFPY